MPIILIGISVVIFFTFSNPIYKNVAQLRAQVASYDEALSNSKALENERDKLTAKESAMSPDDLVKLQKLLPDSINNIRLILEIEQIASPYSMVLKDIKYSITNPTDLTASATGIMQGKGASQTENKDYGVWDLEFSTTGTYNNFLNFTRDLEKNLRIVDISSIQFSSATGNIFNPNLPESYKYTFKIKTYWLKN